MKLNFIKKEYKDPDNLKIKIAFLRYRKNSKRKEIYLTLKRNDFYSDNYKDDNFFYFFHQVYLDTHLSRDYIGNLSSFEIKNSLRFLHNSVVLKSSKDDHQYTLCLE